MGWGVIARGAGTPVSGIKIGFGPGNSSRDATPSRAICEEPEKNRLRLFHPLLRFLSYPIELVFLPLLLRLLCLALPSSTRTRSLNGIGLAPVNARGSRKWDFSFGTQDSKDVRASTTSSTAIYARSLMREDFPSRSHHFSLLLARRRSRYYRANRDPIDPKAAYRL